MDEKSKQTIVVVDDDKQSLLYFSKVLKPFSECNIFCFDRADDDFFTLIENNSVDLFVIDIRLNDLKDGIQVTDEIISKKQGSLFLFISGYDCDEKDFNRLNGRCVYDLLKKPFKIEEFVIKISTLLNIANSYKFCFMSDDCPKPKQKDLVAIEDMNDLRRKYFKMIEEDKLLISRLKKSIFRSAN